jgi:hypothetical protein
MQCQEFEKRLNVVLDERGDPEADLRLATHAQVCERCQRLMAGQRALFTGLLRFSAPPPGARFSKRMVAQVEHLSAARVSAKPSIWLAVGAVLSSAAAALIALSIVWYARQRGASTDGVNGGSFQGSIADIGPQRPSPAPRQRNRTPRPNSNGGTLALVQPWIIEGPRLPDHVQTSLDKLPESLPATIERINQVERMAPGMRPIWRSFAFLWDALCQALPRSHEEEPRRPERTGTWWRNCLQLA